MYYITQKIMLLCCSWYCLLQLILLQSDLSSSQLKALDDVFYDTYMAKYPVVGYMDYLVKSKPEKFAHLKVIKSEL